MAARHPLQVCSKAAMEGLIRRIFLCEFCRRSRVWPPSIQTQATAAQLRHTPGKPAFRISGILRRAFLRRAAAHGKVPSYTEETADVVVLVAVTMMLLIIVLLMRLSMMNWSR